MAVETTIKITDSKAITLGKTYLLFKKPRVAVGLWNNSIVFAIKKPKTIFETQVLIYTIGELSEFIEERYITGLDDIK
jgi:hypothetical protein